MFNSKKPMQLNDIEVSLLNHLFCRIDSGTSDRDLSNIEVKSREMTGTGFITELCISDELNVGDLCNDTIVDDIGAKLNQTIDSGYVIFLDQGHVTAIEGFVYEGNWPKKISNIHVKMEKLGLGLD